ncbi:hypothetical protein BU25DRAFT_447521 [Macroventuria anomochaeta]|uniref:Uncharacterized protein n=1 Tax=Macroventuria anomochaeta TaxID=301207 RepID=A0ACB6S6L8_9PLEO|nr:uncharacterized protein BU25DRAFT_447521 [Macroventuria anomochaeta]KAF2629018.1 hypothetical protein BU25DRAFT_447521 [Macroventuria anomochaeta]
MDLPSHRERNLSRTATINNSHREADFEVIVASCQRYENEADQNDYLDQAVPSSWIWTAHEQKLQTYPTKIPAWDPVQTGIPAIQQYLSRLTVKSNTENLARHIQTEMSDMEAEGKEILQRFEYNAAFSRLSDNMPATILHLDTHLQAHCVSAPRHCVQDPWADEQVRIINVNFVISIAGWKRTMRPNTFKMLLRRNGIDLRRNTVHRNLNRCLSTQYEDRMGRWRYQRSANTKTVCLFLQELIHRFLHDAKDTINQISSTSDRSSLIRNAHVELQRISFSNHQAYGKMVARMEDLALKVYRKFTIETDISCPVAIHMRLLYLQVLHMPPPAKGVFEAQREELMQLANSLGISLSVVMRSALCHILISNWEAVCKSYVKTMMRHLEELPHNPTLRFQCTIRMSITMAMWKWRTS